MEEISRTGYSRLAEKEAVLTSPIRKGLSILLLDRHPDVDLLADRLVPLFRDIDAEAI